MQTKSFDDEYQKCLFCTMKILFYSMINIFVSIRHSFLEHIIILGYTGIKITFILSFNMFKDSKDV